MSTDAKMSGDALDDYVELSVQSPDVPNGLTFDSSPLTFRYEVGKATTVTRMLHNPTEYKIFFKVKTTSPKLYSTKPSVSFVDPMSTKQLQIIRQPQIHCPSEDPGDKFLLLWVSLPSYVKDVSAEAFDPSTNRGLCQNKLQTELIAPQSSQTSRNLDVGERTRDE